MKNKWLWVTLGSIGLAMFIVGTTYAWYYVFHGSFSRAEEVVSELEFQNALSSVDLMETLPMSDEEGGRLVPYEFRLVNNGKQDIRYQIFLEDTAPNVIPDGDTQEKLLQRSQLKYQLVLNDKVVKTGLLSTLSANRLDDQVIAPGTTNRYQLRIWVPTEASNTDWADKHFHYHITSTVVLRGV